MRARRGGERDDFDDASTAQMNAAKILPSRSMRILAVCVALTLVLIAAKNPFALIVLMADGFPAGLIFAAAALGGIGLVDALRLGSLPLRWRLLLGAGLGCGALSTLVLALGAAGFLQRMVWIVLLVLIGTLGAARLRQSRDARSTSAGPAPNKSNPSWAWLCVVPFAALALLCALVPPGWLWAEEGFGYDVLEYHLAMPKEYFEAGRIGYAPHNVYANFPANAEMLYLLNMVIQGDAVDAGVSCQLVHCALAMLVVAAAWMIGRERSPAAGLACAVLAAGLGWLTYLSGLAYVENPMLLFGLLAAACLMRAVQHDASAEPAPSTWRWVWLAGVFAGLACGCKYTAVVLIAAPLAVPLFVWSNRRTATRLRMVGVYAIGVFVAFLPWAVKNVAMTGNPVFPLLGSVFASYPAGWGAAEAAHFAESHRPDPAELTIGARLQAGWRHLFAERDQRFGWPIWIAALVGTIAGRRDRSVRMFALVLAAQVAMWMLTTHLYARFAVGLIIPLIVLASHVPFERLARGRVLGLVLVAATAVNVFFIGRLYASHMIPQGTSLPLEGATGFFVDGVGDGYEHLAVINHDLPPDARVLMVGDARAYYFQREADYCVVFNRDPFADVLRSEDEPSAWVDWLRQRGYSHVWVHWGEIERLRASRYGFPDSVTRVAFRSMLNYGLRRIAAFPDEAAVPFAELFELK